MDITERIERERGTVMNEAEFISFIRLIHYFAGENYSEAARLLKHNAATVRRVVMGRDSGSLRKVLDIKKSSRIRACFECTLETRHNITTLKEITGMEGDELLEDMIKVYFDTLENMP